MSVPFTDQQLGEAAAYALKYSKISFMFPEKGKFRRSLYKKHLEHFEKGATYKQRLFQCANRVGKTTAAGCEITWHLTGQYPKWWKGHRFTKANEWWLCGKDTTTVREIFQKLMLGDVGNFGTGLIPKDLLDFDTMTAAKKGDTLITIFRVKHVPTGEWSTVSMKTYESGRASFEGTAKNIWLDEEPPIDVYNECLARTMSTGGDTKILMMTFTPLRGPTETILNFYKDENGQDGDLNAEGRKSPSKWVTMADWDDVPHLSAADKADLLASTPGHLKDARSKGLAVLGEGQVYSFPEDDIFVVPFLLPEHYRRVSATDFGWTDPTAILWGAIDPETDVLYIYKEHYLREQPPGVHSEVLRGADRIAGFPIPRVCDPSGGGSSTADGKQTRLIYAQQHQIYFISAINSLEPGISLVFDRMREGKIKVFTTCPYFRKEYRSYYRDEKGTLKGPDHLMDALRYMVMSGLVVAKSLAQYKSEQGAGSGRDMDEFYRLRQLHRDCGWNSF